MGGLSQPRKADLRSRLLSGAGLAGGVALFGLADRCRLTPAETRLALHIAEGGSLAGHAELYGVSLGTVRTHLKSVFAKTGTHRQPELVRLLAGKAG